jgi:hypothetical protein
MAGMRHDSQLEDCERLRMGMKLQGRSTGSSYATNPA